MYRGVVSLFLLPCLLPAQSAGLGHCHTGDRPGEHDPRPHIHTNPPATGHGHHRHGHHGPDGHHHGHHHHDDADHHPGDGPEPVTPSPQPEPSPDHDDGAAYVAVDAFLSGRGPVGDEGGRAAPGLVPALVTAAPRTGPCRDAVPWSRPPPPTTGADPPPHLRHPAPRF